MEKKFLSIEELADAGLGSRATIWRYIKQGKLPAIRLGRSYRVPVAALDTLEAAALKGAVGTYDLTRDGSRSEEV